MNPTNRLLLLLCFMLSRSWGLVLPAIGPLRSTRRSGRYLLKGVRRTATDRTRVISVRASWWQSHQLSRTALHSTATATANERVESLKSHIESIPKSPGIYIFRDEKAAILYIGKSVNLSSRVKSYFKAGSLLPATSLSPRIAHMTQLAHLVEYTVTNTVEDALVLEDSLVRAHQPPFNVLLKDDKRYPYVCITFSNVYPKIFVAKRKLPPKKRTETGLQDVYIGRSTYIYICIYSYSYSYSYIYIYIYIYMYMYTHTYTLVNTSKCIYIYIYIYIFMYMHT